MSSTGISTAVPPVPSPVASLEAKVAGVVQKVEATAEAIWNDIKTGITVLKDEGQKVVNFVDTSVPAAAPILSGLITAGEQGAQALATAAASGLQDKASNLGDDAVDLVTNFLQGAGIVTAGSTPSAGAIALAKSLVSSAIDAAFVKGIAGLAAAV